MKNFRPFHKFIPIIILLTSSVFAGMLLMILACCIPVDSVKKDTAFETIWSQITSADYPTLTMGQQYYNSYRPGVFDGGTVGAVITENSYRTMGTDKLTEAMVPSYSRYWHGYMTLLRPLLYLIEYKDLEIMNSFLLLLLAILLCILIDRQKGTAYALLFATSFILLMPMIVGVCLQYIPVVLISYLGILFLSKKREWLEKRNRFYLFIMFLGILTAFFDLLTFPLYSWGIPVLWWILLEPSQKRAVTYVWQVIFSALSWGLGYVGMWSGKWIVGSVILHENIILDAIQQILFRSGDSFTLRDRYYAIYKNWRHYSYQGFALILLIWLIVWIYYGLRKGWRPSNKRYALGLIFLSSLAWYAVCAEHSDIHHYFTYRTFGVMVSAGLALMCESMAATPVPDDAFTTREIHHKTLRYALATGICLAASFVMVFFTREETEVTNKETPCWLEDVYVDSVQMEMDFTPIQSRILGICVAMSTDSTEGYYSLKLYNQDRLVYEEEIPISFMGDFNYVLYPVDWKLKKGNTYRLTIESVGMDTLIKLYISDYDMADYAEVGPVTINGETLNAKSCIGELYWAMPFSRSRKLFLLGTWLTIFLLAWYMMRPDHSPLRSAAS
ncbi:MAG: hypothetical protein IJ794_05265 [Lachnospiraceae bacterium]|nr:hypothetical protein [Lachnospiraceae bacterium]